MLAIATAGYSAAAPHIIPILESSGPPKPAASIDDYQDAFHAIAAVLQRDLGLPTPGVSLYRYPSRDAFAQGLEAPVSSLPPRHRGVLAKG